MKITFRSEDISELNYVRDYQEGFAVSEKSQIREVLHEWDYKGFKSRTHRIYCPGMIFSIIEGESESDLVQILESDFPYLQMHFELSTVGCLYHPKAQFEIDTVVYGGSHCLLFYPSLKGKLNYLKKPWSQSIEIELSLDFLRELFANDLEVLGEFGENIEKSLPAIMGHKSFPITPAMKHILDDVRDCPYSPIFKRLFVEAKVQELLVLQINQIMGIEKSSTGLKSADIEKLNYVRDLLLNNMHSPYSIEELSKIAGINRTKLQEGFKKLFGTTIFGYLTGMRLEEARQRILDIKNEVSIAEIATLSGYKNPQHFTAAFKRKFNLLPKDLKR
jgi:AraC family transcriptional activator of pyochelin receptor